MHPLLIFQLCIDSVNTSTIAIFIISIGTIVYACGLTNKILFRSNYGFKPESLQSTPNTQSEITGATVVTMLIESSLLLLALHFFPLVFIMKIVIFFASFTAMKYVIWDWIFYISRSEYSSIISGVFSVVNYLLWFFTEQWISANSIAITMSIFAISFIKIHSGKIIIILSLLFLIYDVWWVFLSPRYFGTSVMVSVATKVGFHLPITITIPLKDRRTMIGCGDIALPGMVLDFLMRFDLKHGSHCFNSGIVGYGIGVIVSYVAVELMGKAQPALLWLFPCILIAVTVCCFIEGYLLTIWNWRGESDGEGSIGVEKEEEDSESVKMEDVEEEDTKSK